MIFSRLQLYFIPYIVVVIPNILNVIVKNQRRVIYILIIALGLAYMCRALSINGGQPLPYQSILTRL